MRMLPRLLGLRRLLAFMVDWCVIALYGGGLFGLVVLLNGGVPALGTPYSPLQGQAIGFVSLTLPVVLYFSVSEHHYGRTLGKRLLGLRVKGISGGNPSFGSALLRNSLKFLPWEMAHYTVHQFTASQLAHQSPHAVTYVLLALVYLLSGIYVIGILWLRDGPIYDRAAKTDVTTNRPS